jgi:hypothetical protein
MPPDAWTRFQQSAPGASWHKVGTFQTLAQPSAHLTLTAPPKPPPGSPPRAAAGPTPPLDVFRTW